MNDRNYQNLWKYHRTNRVRDGALLAARVAGASVAEVMAQFKVSKASVPRICKLERIRQAIDRLVQSNRKEQTNGKEEGTTQEGVHTEGGAGATQGGIGDSPTEEKAEARPQTDQ